MPVLALDAGWRLIKTAVESGQLGPGAKVATLGSDFDSGPTRRPVIIYTADYHDEQRILLALRSLSVRDALAYKTDEATARGEYGTEPASTPAPTEPPKSSGVTVRPVRPHRASDRQQAEDEGPPRPTRPHNRARRARSLPCPRPAEHRRLRGRPLLRDDVHCAESGEARTQTAGSAAKPAPPLAEVEIVKNRNGARLPAGHCVLPDGQDRARGRAAAVDKTRRCPRLPPIPGCLRAAGSGALPQRRGPLSAPGPAAADSSCEPDGAGGEDDQPPARAGWSTPPGRSQNRFHRDEHSRRYDRDRNVPIPK
ncbi:putative phosphothreonine lyase domain-containing protein [Streptomyces exfoliatus]|uniref:Phosphothreonine lyase domain-containing protein n=1 Tax=Streptomyces exfoliatus TaxID=1905 RepID=A0ABV3D7K1_STREX